MISGEVFAVAAEFLMFFHNPLLCTNHQTRNCYRSIRLIGAMNRNNWTIGVIIGVVGLTVSQLYTEPGAFDRSFGDLRFDLYYFLITGFASVLILSLANIAVRTMGKKGDIGG